MHVYMITGVIVSTDMEMVNDLFHRIMKKGGGHKKHGQAGLTDKL